MNSSLPDGASGSVMVEFAGALILLLLLVFGISEIGRAIYQLNTLTKSVEAGARYMSRATGIVNFDPDAGAAEEQCQVNNAKWDTASEHASNIILYGTEAVGSMTRLPDMEVTSISVSPHLDSGLSNGGACVIKVSARAQFLSIFASKKPAPPLYGQDSGDSDGLVLAADAEERYIGE
jgi:Flp pilus assembly protein TadG